MAVESSDRWPSTPAISLNVVPRHTMWAANRVPEDLCARLVTVCAGMRIPWGPFAVPWFSAACVKELRSPNASTHNYIECPLR